jgi:hypothetical protein
MVCGDRERAGMLRVMHVIASKKNAHPNARESSNAVRITMRAAIRILTAVVRPIPVDFE